MLHEGEHRQHSICSTAGWRDYIWVADSELVGGNILANNVRICLIFRHRVGLLETSEVRFGSEGFRWLAQWRELESSFWHGGRMQLFCSSRRQFNRICGDRCEYLPRLIDIIASMVGRAPSSTAEPIDWVDGSQDRRTCTCF